MTAKKVEPTEGIAQTVIPGDQPEPDKSVSLTSPWGSKVTVAADAVADYKADSYKGSK